MLLRAHRLKPSRAIVPVATVAWNPEPTPTHPGRRSRHPVATVEPTKAGAKQARAAIENPCAIFSNRPRSIFASPAAVCHPKGMKSNSAQCP
jgi:hypothetical protein